MRDQGCLSPCRKGGIAVHVNKNNSPRQSCVKREIIWNIDIRSVFNSPDETKGKRGEN